jgi:hypothetical protein
VQSLYFSLISVHNCRMQPPPSFGRYIRLLRCHRSLDSVFFFGVMTMLGVMALLQLLHKCLGPSSYSSDLLATSIAISD